MPEIKLKCVSSFSSEDKVYTAENLLKPETFRKWKCATPGEKSASVIIQFEKASQINSLDIGNELSAFVEVFVGRSSFTLEQYQVLLVSSSFMTPLESRNETNASRVRMFNSEKLCQNTKNEKWDCVQIVCTQPFNKNIQYGLSFVKFYAPPDPEATAQTKPAINLGTFKIRNDTSDEEDSLQVGSWFNKRQNVSDTNPATIRQAAAQMTTTITVKTQFTPPATSTRLKRKNEDSSSPNPKKDSYAVKIDKKDESPKMSQPEKKVVKTADQKSRERNEKVLAATRTAKVKKKKPLNEIMKNIVFALSGFPNPFRSEIRDRALQMGAKYKADWDPSCTHLVCAFLNTPKFVQVHAHGGRIVLKEWILDSFNQKELQPWRSYMLGTYADRQVTDNESSEEEETVNIPAQNAGANVPSTSEINNSGPSTSAVKPDKEKRVFNDDSSSAGSDYAANTESDTEDELKKHEDMSKATETLNGEVNEEVRQDTKDLPLPILPDFFKKKHFFFYGDFPDKEKHDLERYITAFDGKIVNYMADDVQYVVTNFKWNENFDDALSENENLIFVRPRWIFSCNKNGRIVPFQPYVVVPETNSF